MVAAHPDDEVLGCGGTIARLVQEKNDVYIAVLGEGVTARYPQRDQADPKRVQKLRESCRRAAQRMGAKDPLMYDLPDNRFDSVPILEVVKIIEGLIDRLQPRVIYAQHGGDLNIDHSIVFRATLTATRPAAGTPVKELYAFEVGSSTEWSFQKFEPVFRPNVFVDISGTMTTKIQAMEIYEGEVQAFPHPRSSEALRASAARWGTVSGTTAAEAFELVRLLR